MQDDIVQCQCELAAWSEVCERCMREEFGLPQKSTTMARRFFELSDGRRISALHWHCHLPPGLILIHGGAQSAHCWDAVALALDQPLLAIDLPSHGHSDSARDGIHDPANLAADLIEVLLQVDEKHNVPARTLCGMSLGGLACIRLYTLRPDLVQSLILVDVTPGICSSAAHPLAPMLILPVYLFA